MARNAGANVDRIAEAIPPTRSFRSPFTILPFTLLHASRFWAIIPVSSLPAGTGMRNRLSRQVWRRREPRAVGGHLRPGPDLCARVPSKEPKGNGPGKGEGKTPRGAGTTVPR